MEKEDNYGVKDGFIEKPLRENRLDIFLHKTFPSSNSEQQAESNKKRAKSNE